MSNLLIKTAESKVNQDKNGRNYKTVTFTEVVTMHTPFGDVQKPLNQCKSNRTNVYESRYLDQKMDIGYSDSLFNPKNPANGGIFQGSIETRQVEEYDIPDTQGTNGGDPRTVNTFTTVVFGDTNSPAYESLVIAAFKSKGHVVVEAANTVVQQESEVF